MTRDKTVTLLAISAAALALCGATAAMAGFPAIAEALLYGAVGCAGVMLGLIALGVIG